MLTASCNQFPVKESTDLHASHPDSITQLIKEHLKTVNALRYTHPDSVFKVLDIAVQLSKRLIDSNDKEQHERGLLLLAETYNFRGVTKSNMGNYDEALQLHREALKIYREIGDERGIGDTYTDMAYAYRLNGQYTEALDYNLKNMEICKKTGFLHGLGQAYGNIGIIYYYQEDYDKALEYYEKHYIVGKQNNNGYEQLIALNNMGEVYDKCGDFEKSISLYREAVQIADSLGSLYQAAYILGNIGQAEQKRFNYEKARTYYEQSLSIREKIDDKEGIAIMYNRLASLHLSQNEFTKSIDFSKQGFSIAKEYHIPVEMKKACENLYRAFEKKGDFEEAFHYHKQFKAWSDSVFKSARNNEIAEIEIKYKTREKEQQISLLTEQDKIRILELKRARLLGVFLSITAALVLFIAVLYYRRYQFKSRMNNQLEILNARLLESQNHLRELNITKDRFFSILAHDLKSPLLSFRTITTSLSENIDRVPPDQLAHYIGEMKHSAAVLVDLFNNLLAWAMSQTKRIDFRPEPIVLNEIIQEVIALYAGTINHKKINIEWSLEKNDRIFADRNMLATLIRNLVSNAVKFTPPEGSIGIVTLKIGKYCKFVISDTGPGLSFDDQKKLFRIDVANREIGVHENKGSGLGLILCKEFVEKNGGEIGVASEPGRGCSFWFTLKRCETKDETTENQTNNSR